MTESEHFQWISLNTRVLIVAVVNMKAGDWSAYIGAVDGIRHEDEFMDVAKTGSKVDREVAEHYFPHFKKYLWRG